VFKVFRDPSVRFAGKTGSFGGAFRNEVGVAEFPDGRRYAIAVFTKGLALYSHQRGIDDAIGVAAGLAVDALRSARARLPRIQSGSPMSRTQGLWARSARTSGTVSCSSAGASTMTSIKSPALYNAPA